MSKQCKCLCQWQAARDVAGAKSIVTVCAQGDVQRLLRWWFRRHGSCGQPAKAETGYSVAGLPKTVAIIQARTGSTRLPRKTLARVLDRPLLDLMLERVEWARTLDDIVLATTRLAQDDDLAAIAGARGVAVVRGSELDVLTRFTDAAVASDAEIVVRLTADCPLIDPVVIDRLVRIHREVRSRVDLLTNSPPIGRTYPDGMDVEVFAAGALSRADALSSDPRDREHVTRRMHEPPFVSEVVGLERSAAEVRVSVDEPGDLARVRMIFEDLYPRDPRFGLAEVVRWWSDHMHASGAS